MFKGKNILPRFNLQAFSLSGSVDGEAERILDHGDMSYIAIQIASGMEYLAQHQVRKIFTIRKNI